MQRACGEIASAKNLSFRDGPPGLGPEPMNTGDSDICMVRVHRFRARGVSAPWSDDVREFVSGKRPTGRFSKDGQPQRCFALLTLYGGTTHDRSQARAKPAGLDGAAREPLSFERRRRWAHAQADPAGPARHHCTVAATDDDRPEVGRA